jgi:hypothetical protein
MKNNKNIFDIIVKICSVLILVLGFFLILYIFFGPSLGLIDAESASWGFVIALPVIVIGVISTILSFTGHPKVSAVIIILYVFIFVLNIWNQHRLDSPGIPTTPGGIPLTNLPLPPIPHPLNK